VWSEMMSESPAVFSASCQTRPQTACAPPGVFEEVQKMQNNETNRVQQTMRLQTASAVPVMAMAVDCSSPPAAATPAFRVGMQVEVFSVSQDRWLLATVSEMTAAASTKGGCTLPAGSVCVLYAANSKAKWLTPESAASLIRKPQEVPMGIMDNKFCVNCGGKVPAELLEKNTFKFCIYCGKQHPEIA